VRSTEMRVCGTPAVAASDGVSPAQGQFGAPGRIRTRDPLLRRSFPGSRWPARPQVGGYPSCPRLTLDDRDLPYILARIWHASVVWSWCSSELRLPAIASVSGCRSQRFDSAFSRLT
jgi:hypothetical protein